MSEVTAQHSRVEASSRSLLWGTSWTTLYTGVNILAKLARGLILPRFLLPATYGLWSSLSVILSYTPYADLGVQQQLDKRLPYHLGKDGVAGYWDLAGRGIAWVTCSTLAAASLIFVASFFFQGPGAWFYRTALRILALVIVARNARALLTTMLVARQEFRAVAISGSMTDVLALALAIGGLLTMGVIGLVWALLLSEIVGALVCLCYVWSLGLTQARWQLQGVAGMIREGLWLLGLALLDQTMMNVDQLFLLGFFPKEQYGTYALGLFIVATIIAISGIFLTAQPRILKLWGAGKKDESRRMVEVNLSLYIIVAALSVAPFSLLTDLMINHYLQHYAAGLPLYVLMPVIALARGPVILLGPHYLSNNHERRLLAFRAAGLLLAVALNVLVVWRGWSLACIVLASAAGYLLTGALVFRDFERFSESVGRAKYAMLLASLVGVVGLFLFYEYRSQQSTAARYAAETLGALLAYLALVCGVLIATSRSWRGNLRLFNEGASFPLISSLRERLGGTVNAGRSPGIAAEKHP